MRSTRNTVGGVFAITVIDFTFRIYNSPVYHRVIMK